MVEYRPSPLNKVPWEEFQAPYDKKCNFLTTNNNPNHVIFSQQFNRPLMEEMCNLATTIRLIAKDQSGFHFLSNLLSHKRAMLYFVQPSSRTFLSFHSACQTLGLRIAETRDMATSSEIKGESQVDTVRTLASYFDMIIMRHPSEGFAEKIAWALDNSDRPVPVINGGSGRDQHPTQALLDIYTLQRSFENKGGIDGKKIAIVGDLARGRTARSLARLLTQFQDVELYFVSPPSLPMGEDVLGELDQAGLKYFETDQFREVLPMVDAVYMMRIQDEYEIGVDNSTINYENFHITDESLELLKKDAIIMHPLPRRAEIAVSVDRDPRAMYWRQVRNGMWVRTALIAKIFGVDGLIRDYVDRQT